jgi:hypothetical protein
MSDPDSDNPFADLDGLRKQSLDLARFASTPAYLRLRPKYVGVGGKYQIGELGFPSKTAVKEYFGGVRTGFIALGNITEPALGDLKALLARHRTFGHEAPVSFHVEPNGNGPGWGYGLWFVRADGTSDVFSIDGCLSEANPLADAKKACRFVLIDDRNAVLDAEFDQHAGEDGCIECSECTARVSRADVEADHAAPQTFEVLFRCFVAALYVLRDITLETFVHRPQGGMSGPQIRDPSLREAFIRYHRGLAYLRPLCPKCNMRAGHVFRINKEDRKLILPGPEDGQW